MPEIHVQEPPSFVDGPHQLCRSWVTRPGWEGPIAAAATGLRYCTSQHQWSVSRYTPRLPTRPPRRMAEKALTVVTQEAYIPRRLDPLGRRPREGVRYERRVKSQVPEPPVRLVGPDVATRRRLEGLGIRVSPWPMYHMRGREELQCLPRKAALRPRLLLRGGAAKARYPPCAYVVAEPGSVLPVTEISDPLAGRDFPIRDPFAPPEEFANARDNASENSHAYE